MTVPPRVLVLGAAGTLGRRVVRRLQAAGGALEVVGAGRRPGRAPTARARRLDLDDPDSWTAALDGIRVLVHAAGPFDRDPRPLVRACLEAGVHWVDLAEDAGFVARVREAAARPESRACAVAGCSTVPGLVQGLARGLPEAERIVQVDAVLALGSRNPVSAALLVGLLRPLGRPGPGGPWLRALEPHRFDDGAVRWVGRYPSGLEASGVDLAGRPVPLRFWIGFDRRWISQGLALAGRLLPRLEDTWLRRIACVGAPLASAVRPFGSARGRLAVLGRDAAGDTLAGVEVHAASDGLEVPAAPAAWAARVLAVGESGGSGPRTLVDLVPPERIQRELRRMGCEVRRLRGATQ